jgi:hypothetical protein
MERREWWEVRDNAALPESACLKTNLRGRAEEYVLLLRAQGRTVRLVRVVEEVVPVEG